MYLLGSEKVNYIFFGNSSQNSIYLNSYTKVIFWSYIGYFKFGLIKICCKYWIAEMDITTYK